MRALIDSGVTLLIEENESLPRAARDRGIALGRGIVVDSTARDALTIPDSNADPVSSAIAKSVAGLVPPGALLQYGPGPIGNALLRALEVPVRIASGMISDAVIDLADRGILIDEPSAAYLAGTHRLYQWADGRPIATRIEESHGAAITSRKEPLVAVNGAIEIDHTAQVNVERAGAAHLSGIGGHSDFCLAASRSNRGLSIIALPTTRHGTSTLVERLAAPASTPRSDVNIVVTELGTADLRGLDDNERAAELLRCWGRA